ncbi:MAG: methylenetetrahydrofolate--tRNA-(uracil(54)-C(5))-methyltransferase (FADH(2)-oxidizing) TrmFO [Acidaminococcaceae bacterium]|nr:methylenetetrahydrofolate--tRNA-(uracil(54)-C(5))-methyltransferase (FADH(2)-oxidizing) TrmFO [Acidaminococcaceae bacterium]
MNIHVIGAGLAGCEAVWQLISRQVPVILHEMRPLKHSSAHKTDLFGELVCSNSLRANNIENAVGLLKEEMRLLDSLIISMADKYQVPAGGALAVDREGFAKAITCAIKNHPLVTLVEEEVSTLNFPPEDYVIISTGPLTSEALSAAIKDLVHTDYFHFFDAAAPILEADTLNYDKVYKASRYNKGEAAYLNCPFTESEYKHFWQELCNAEVAHVEDFEKGMVFEGCMPIEEMAKRGEDTMRFGPLKPVGLVDPRTGSEAYAVAQLRQDDGAGTLYNIVGFQTHLKWPEQKRVFGLIPGLEKAEFVRYGVMHKNSYINSPMLLNKYFALKSNPHIFFAGQVTGVEGYVESAASGLMVGINVARVVQEKELIAFPEVTAHGALAKYISNPQVKDLQPMNVNFGIIPPLEQHKRMKKKEKNAALAQRGLDALKELLNTL